MHPAKAAAPLLHLVQDGADITLDPHQLPAKVRTSSLMATDVLMQLWSMHNQAAGLADRMMISNCLRSSACKVLSSADSEKQSCMISHQVADIPCRVLRPIKRQCDSALEVHGAFGWHLFCFTF